MWWEFRIVVESGLSMNRCKILDLHQAFECCSSSVHMVGKHMTPVAYNPVVQSPLRDYQVQQGIYPVLDDGLPHYYLSLKGERIRSKCTDLLMTNCRIKGLYLSAPSWSCGNLRKCRVMLVPSKVGVCQVSPNTMCSTCLSNVNGSIGGAKGLSKFWLQYKQCIWSHIQVQVCSGQRCHSPVFMTKDWCFSSENRS